MKAATMAAAAPAGSRRPTVIALHGTAGSPAQWDGLTGYIGGRYHVVASDLAARETNGGCVAPLDDAAAQVAGLIEAAGAPAHLVGHARGASVALRAAMTAPGLVRSLVLLEPRPLHPLVSGGAVDRALFAATARLAGHMRVAVNAGRPADAARRHVEFWYGAGAWVRTSRRLQAHFVANAARIAEGLALDLEESWSGLEEVACPVLAVMGLETAPVSLRATELMAETMPRARLAMVPDAGHMAFLTDPHIVDPLILRHLNSAERGDGTTFGTRRQAA